LRRGDYPKDLVFVPNEPKEAGVTSFTIVGKTMTRAADTEGRTKVAHCKEGK